MTEISKDDLKASILHLINTNGALKELDLALKILDSNLPTLINQDVYNQCLKELLEEGKMLELNYTIAENTDINRLKAIYFPAGAKIVIPAIQNQY